MKKIFSILLIAFLLMGCNHAANNALTIEEAQKIALKEVDGKVVKAKEDRDDGISYYDFSIITDTEKYEIEVDANTGAILKKEKDNDYVGTNTTTGNDNQSTGTENKEQETTISAEEAQKIAMDRVGGGYLVKCELDNDHGILQYEVDIKNGNKEYDVDIDAKTGEIINFKEEYDD